VSVRMGVKKEKQGNGEEYDSHEKKHGANPWGGK